MATQVKPKLAIYARRMLNLVRMHVHLVCKFVLGRVDCIFVCGIFGCFSTIYNLQLLLRSKTFDNEVSVVYHIIAESFVWKNYQIPLLPCLWSLRTMFRFLGKANDYIKLLVRDNLLQ